MGDVSSTAIGFFLTGVPFASQRPIPVLAVVLALSLFVLDAMPPWSGGLFAARTGTQLIEPISTSARWPRVLAMEQSHTEPAEGGMVVVAAMAAVYPSVGRVTQLLLVAASLGIFLGGWMVVRHLERGERAGSLAS
jgi:UDP-N-acetylmuramyl pentapeptide phosphotransferase/UDP-N-acetylglucosamine-1-phosphate transferase